MSKILLPLLLIAFVASACSTGAKTPEQVVDPGGQDAKPVVTIFRPPT